MEVTYDPRYNIAYIRFREQTTEVDSVRVSDEINIDLAPDGTVYGIELLNANEQIPAINGRTLALEDTSTGKRTEFPWPDAAAS